MFSLSTPAWLVGLGALSIPVALHLWSRRPSQVVRMGTLEHLAGAPGPMAWGRKLDDLPLLALRLATLSACVLGLAGPRWLTDTGGAKINGTLVIADPALVADSLTFYSDPLVDSLRRSQIPIHLLEDGLPILGAEGGGVVPAGLVGPTIWASLIELDRHLPPDQTVLVIARLTAGDLGPARPPLSRTVQWYEPAAPTPSRERVVASWRSSPDSTVELVDQRSAFSTSRFLRSTAAVPRTETPGGGRQSVASNELNDRSALFAFVQLIQGQHDRNVMESLVAAVHASLLSGQGFIPGSSPSSTPGRLAHSSTRGVIVWLDVQSVSDSIMAKVAAGSWLLQFVPVVPVGPVAEPDTRIARAVRVAGLQTAPWLAALPPGTPGAVTVEDPAGRPVVSTERHGAGRWLRIGVAPGGWGVIAGGDPALPLLIHRLLSRDRPADVAPVYGSQANPTQRRTAATSVRISTDLAAPLLWIALLLLVGERLLVHHRQRNPA